MKTILTMAQAVERARLLLGFDHTREDGDSNQVNGTNVNVLLERLVRQWYLNILDHGEARYVIPAPVEGMLLQADRSPAGAVVLKLPSSCRRAVSVRLPGWARSAEVLPGSELDETVNRQLNPFTAAEADSPVAVMLSEQGKTVACWPPYVSDTGSPSASGIIDTGKETITLDDSALLTLGPFLKKYFSVN